MEQVLSMLTAQPAIKFVLRMLSLFLMLVLKRVVISPYAEHAQKFVIP
jgi:hypothetical protein